MRDPIMGTLSGTVKDAREWITSAQSIGSGSLSGTSPPNSRQQPFGKLTVRSTEAEGAVQDEESPDRITIDGGKPQIM